MVVGHSAGAGVALALGAYYPERVRGAVLSGHGFTAAIDNVIYRLYLADTWSHESGSPSPIVQIQERHVPELKSGDEHFIIHRASAPPRIQDHRDRRDAREAGLNWAIDTEIG